MQHLNKMCRFAFVMFVYRIVICSRIKLPRLFWLSLIGHHDVWILLKLLGHRQPASMSELSGICLQEVLHVSIVLKKKRIPIPKHPTNNRQTMLDKLDSQGNVDIKLWWFKSKNCQYDLLLKNRRIYCLCISWSRHHAVSPHLRLFHGIAPQLQALGKSPLHQCNLAIQLQLCDIAWPRVKECRLLPRKQELTGSWNWCPFVSWQLLRERIQIQTSKLMKLQ